MMKLVMSERLRSDDELDEDCEVCQADRVMMVSWIRLVRWESQCFRDSETDE